MKFAIFVKTVCVIQLAFVFAQYAEAQTVTLPLDSSTLFDSNFPQGNGMLGNNADIFDGTIFMNAPVGVFATSLYVRERESLTQPQLEVRADLNFDLSGVTAPVTAATLEFTAYALNDNSDFTVARLLEGGTDFDRDLADEISVPRTFPGPSTIANYSIDVTTIVNTWVSDPTSNLGFRIQLNDDINEGIGLFDGTATEINDGAGGFLPIPADYLPMQLVLDGVVVPACVLGDVDTNGVVNILDISPFIMVLSSGSFQCEADIDENGVVNILDITPFINLLSQ